MKTIIWNIRKVTTAHSGTR